MEKWDKNGFYDKLKSFAKAAGEIASSIGKFILEHPFAALIAWKGLEVLTWVKNGMALGKGFNMVASAGGVGGGGGPGGGGLANTGFMGMGGSRMSRLAATSNRFGGNRMLTSLAGGGSRFAAGSMGSLVGGAGLGIAGMGLDALRGEEGSQGYDSGSGKFLGVGSSALKGAGMGMMLGPWGALIGGILGGAYGAFNEFGDNGRNKTPASTSTYLADDALISNDGRNNGGPGSRIQFNPHDKFMSFDDVMIAGTNAGANGKLAEEIKGKGKDKGGRGNDKQNIHHTGELRIAGISNLSKLSKLIMDEIINNPSYATDMAHSNATSNNANKKFGKGTGKGSRELLT